MSRLTSIIKEGRNWTFFRTELVAWAVGIYKYDDSTMVGAESDQVGGSQEGGMKGGGRRLLGIWNCRLATEPP